MLPFNWVGFEESLIIQPENSEAFRKAGIGTVSSQAVSLAPSETVMEEVLLYYFVTLNVQNEGGTLLSVLLWIWKSSMSIFLVRKSFQ